MATSMSQITSADQRIMIGVAIFLIAIAICLAPWFFVGSGSYQVAMFGAGLAILILSFGYLMV
jgi:hypothetical protein